MLREHTLYSTKLSSADCMISDCLKGLDSTGGFSFIRMTSIEKNGWKKMIA